jgi:scyllo-inositol 2-dehydrogenase (NADP+)
MNFEAPLSEWHVMVLGDDGIAVVDVFRDIAVFVPSDRQHRSLDVLRTSAAATAAHWTGYLSSGAGHVRGSLLYGVDEVFSRFHRAICDGAPPQGVAGEDALAVLRIQQWILDAAR